MKSKPYKRGKKLFRYDFDTHMVEYIWKADGEMLQDNEEWMEKFHKPLWEIDADGYCVADSAGLCQKNWTNKELRDTYIDLWIDELEEEVRCEMAMFVKYELPNYI